MSSSPTSSPRPRSRPRARIGLSAKLTGILLLVALLPLAVTIVLVDNLAEVAHNFASNHVEELRPHLERSQEAYRQLIVAKKEEYRQTASRLAIQVELSGANGVNDELLVNLLEEHPELIELSVRGPSGGSSYLAKRSLGDEALRLVDLVEELSADRKLELRFGTRLSPQADLQELDRALEVSRQVDELKTSLPNSYRLAFLLLLGAVVVGVTFIGMLAARRVSRRISVLVRGTREVASGDLKATVDLGGSDELAELASAFNRMVTELEQAQAKSAYLQRIGAWQDVARRLAHEIKNPLTPIQLVVQQVASSYEGDDPKYKKLLATCDEIVGEEVGNLRRLVDAFRDLGRLPKVEAVSLPCARVAEDLRSDPNLADTLSLEGDESLAVAADRLLLRRALTNLLENGIQAGREAGREGRVLLRWERREQMVCFRIHDEGAGVPADKREAIFEPYITSKDTGTGLGLAICKKIALDHKGSLRVLEESGELGGACFELCIPGVSAP